MARPLRWALVLLAFLIAGRVEAQPGYEPHLHIVATDFVMPSKFEALRAWGEEIGVDVSYRYIDESPASPPVWQSADLVIFDAPLRGRSPDALEALEAQLSGAGIAWIWPSARGPLQAGGDLAPARAGRISAYYEAGGEENFRNLLTYLAGGEDSVPPPAPRGATGFYHPDAPRVFADYAAYLEWGAGRWADDAPRLAVVTSPSVISDLQTAVLDAIVAEAEREGVQPILFWFDRQAERGMHDALVDADIDVIANFTHLQGGEARKAELAALDVPAIILMQDRSSTPAQWREAAQGVNPGYAAALLSTPEAWGMGDAIVVAGTQDGELAPIPEQVALLVRKARSIAHLRDTAPAERRAALFFWNTPSGERNMSASNLNVPASVAAITRAMDEAGYTLEPLDEDRIIADFQAMLGGYYHPERLEGLLDAGQALTLPVSRYEDWLDTVPDHVARRVEERWGAPEAHWAVRQVDGEAHFIIPAMADGHLLLLPQPPRADTVGESYHDTLVPPGHLYLATYLMVREAFGADAIIHLGTHGTQEWTPGKDRGLWAFDYPHLAVGDAVVIYPYIQDNIAEAIQAIRRGRATTISHQTPAFAPSGFYDELRDIHDLIHQIEQLDEGPVREETLQRLARAAIEAEMHRDIGWEEADVTARPGAFLMPLHDHLHDLAAQATPLGLHTFGSPAEPEHRVMTVMQQLGDGFYRQLGADPQEVFAADHAQIADSAPFRFLRRFLIEGESVDTVADPDLRAMIEQAVENERHLAETGEIGALMHALEGGFTPAGPGGDPVRNPRTSSGRNLYAFEPDKVPTRSAYEAGGIAFEQLITAHRDAHNGAYPNKLAFSIFSSDTIRTLGITEAQIMHAIGVRPVWGRGDTVVDLEIIPSGELGRPRIDVVLQLTSVYRDQFDGLMRLLAQAMDEISRMDEPDNGLFSGRARVRTSLIARGVAPDEAERLSGLRLFSSAPGDYGTGVPDAALDSTGWEDDRVIADTFLASQSYAYGADTWGEPVAAQGLLESQLEGVDVAVLSRSSNLHGILSTDHPFEHLGGLSAAARLVNGTSPSLYITDLRRRDPRTVPASQFLSTELRARYLNPQWIEAMQAEGYAGTVEILSVTNNLFGWQAVDPSMVRNDQWQAWHETYVSDRRQLGLNEWFAQNNATAQAQIVERMAEAIRKGYWEASEQTRRELAERWLELTRELGADRGDPVTVDFLEAEAAGFGMDLSAPAAPAEPRPDSQAPDASSAAQTVTGQVMEAVEASEYRAPDLVRLAGIAVLLLFFVLGAVSRIRLPQSRRHT